MKVLSSNKLFELLSVLDASEWRKMGRLKQVTDSDKLSRFYAFLNSYYPDFKLVKNSKPDIYHAVFGNGAYQDKKLRYLFTDLQQIAEELLTELALKSDTETGSRLLASELARRGANKNYLSIYNKDANNTSGDAPPASEKYFADFRREETHLLHYLPGQPRGETNIVQTARNLDLFYLVKKLQLMCEMVNSKNVLASDHQSALSEEITGALQKGIYSDMPAVAAWYRVWLTLTDPGNESNFIALRNTLADSLHEFPQQELRDLYQYLMNFCIRRINTGATEYVRTLLDIYRIILEKGIIFTDGHLSQWDYKNITAIGIRAGETQWTGSFINEYRLKLPPLERENAYTYNRAYYLFNTGQRSEALSLLRQVEFSDLYYQLDSRVILLKCYFENGDEDAFFYHASAFRLFLARNKQVSEYQRTVYRNLIRFSSKILQANGNIKKLSAIREEVERVKNVADIGWILRKL